MHYELVTLDKLIQEKPEIANLKKIQNWINLACQETERIKSAFTTELFSDKNTITFERYIQIHQKSLLQMANLLEAAAKKGGNRCC